MNPSPGETDLPTLLASDLGPEALAGVSLSLTNGCLTVAFSHPYLAPFWKQRFQQQLEAAARRHLGANLFFAYTEVDSEPGAPRQPETTRPEAQDFFGDFISTEKNSQALQAARELCDPACTLATLLLTGDSGAGKSHLLAAIGRALGQLLGARAVLRVPVGLLPALDFWERSKALLVEDIQLILTDAPQGETLARHVEQGCQPGRYLALTCHSEAKLERFPKRLRLRLQQLLQVSLPRPDLALRVRWLETQNTKRTLGLSTSQIFQLARKGRHIPELAGLLQKLEFYGRIGNRVWAWQELENLAPPEQTQPWLRVFAQVAARFAVTPADLIGASRRREIVFGRQVAMYVCRQKLGLSYPELGRIFGGRDHATVIHSIRKIEQLRQVDADLHKLLAQLTEDWLPEQEGILP